MSGFRCLTPVRVDPTLADSFYENYRDTEKEKLLGFLKDHPAIEALRNFSQKDLAIFISEQWALGLRKSPVKLIGARRSISF